MYKIILHFTLGRRCQEDNNMGPEFGVWECRSPKTQSPAEGPDSKEGQSPIPSVQRLQIYESQIQSSNPTRETRIQRCKSPVLNMERGFCLDKPNKWVVSTRNQRRKVDTPYEVEESRQFVKSYGLILTTLSVFLLCCKYIFLILWELLHFSQRPQLLSN